MTNENELEVVKIFKDYKVAVKIVDLFEKGNINIVDKTEREKLNKLYFHKSYVEALMEVLDYQNKNFLINQYVKNNPETWWMGYYSKSTFYRQKNKAIKNFLECYRYHESINYLQ